MWGRRYWGNPYWGPRYWGKGSVAQVTVPDVVGQTEAAGTATLQGAGFAVSVNYEYSSIVAAGLIISQAPTGGSEALPGTTVIITVSLGERSDGAGKSKRKKRYFVEIDGQTFEVASPEHAKAVFDRARELAKSHAEQLAKAVVPTTKKLGTKPVKLATPSINSPDPELKEVVREARKAINEIYRKAAVDTELYLLMARAMAEDEEESLLLLM